MRIRYSSIFRFIAISFFVLIVSGAQSLFSSTASLDAQSITQLANEGDFEGGSYAMMSLIYYMLPQYAIFLLVIFLGSLFLFYSTRHLTTNIHAAIIAFLCLAPSILAVATFQKDLLLVPFIVFAALSIEKIPVKLLSYAALSIVYISYALLFRNYFAVILASFFIFTFYGKSSSAVRFMLVAALVLVLILSPEEIFQKLQGSRDFVNMHRVNQPGAEGYRTAFVNLMPIRDSYSFVANYIYAFLRLNLPFIFYPGSKELFLGFNVAAYFYFSIWGVMKGGRASKMAGTLILAHIAVLNLFEPDLGSYIRHLSTTLPFLAIPAREFFEVHGYSIRFRAPDPRRASGQLPRQAIMHTPD